MSGLSVFLKSRLIEHQNIFSTLHVMLRETPFSFFEIFSRTTEPTFTYVSLNKSLVCDGDIYFTLVQAIG